MQNRGDFQQLPNVFIIADILIVGYDVVGKDHDRRLKSAMQICHKDNLKLNKDRYNSDAQRFPSSVRSYLDTVYISPSQTAHAY